MDTAENQLARSAPGLAVGVQLPKRPLAVGTRPPPTATEESRLGLYLVAASLAIIALLLALSAL